MTNENEKRIYDIIDQIPITDKNKKQIEEIKWLYKQEIINLH